ncbi:MAG: FAD-dependent oxidoreductase [Deltaproteobacteria bacterium]|nr:FAD-dependent oxidoreductase [Deltaproteobacteria bacterium]
MKKYAPKLLLMVVLIILAVSFFMFDLEQYFTLGSLKEHQQTFERYYEQHMGLTLFLYFMIYVVMAAVSLPGAAVMTLAGGALFGLGVGVVIVSFASSIGATLAFFVSRFLLRENVQSKFGEKLTAINEGVRKDGAFYLFTLRLVPIFPFFVINLVLGLTHIRALVFYIVSQLGMFPGTLVYVNAGTQLAKIESLQDILSPTLIFSFVLLGVFPLIAKAFISFIKRRRIYAKWPKPEKFDYNMVVIGGGSAGLVASYIGAAVKARVALIEKHKMGGDCLNTGCVPSKALIRSAKMLAYARRAKEFGFRSGTIDYNFADVMERVQRVIRKVEPHDSVERYTRLGVEVIQGEARITSPFTIEVNGRILSTRNIIVATGARPFVPPIPGLDQVKYLTSDNVWEMRSLPSRLVILGGGPIGCELTQTFARLGSDVTQVEMMPRIMLREDEDVSEMIHKKFEDEGIRVLTGHKAKEVRVDGKNKILVCENASGEVKIEFDEILVAVGRAANAKGFGLEELGVTLRPNGAIETNGLLQTNYPNIYCSGDVAGPYQFTHTAAHQSWYASVNALFGKIKRFAVDYRVIPWATFTDPEVARVGLNIQEAKEKNIPHEVIDYGIDDLDRAIADSEDHGLVRVLTHPGTDKIIGVTIVGAHAGDLIAEYVLAMKNNLGLKKIMGTIHIYPTLAEANKYAAGTWKKAHTPEKLLHWIGRYHAWMRG